MHQSFINPLAQYCSEQSSPEPQYLKDLTAFTWKQMVNPRMLSGHLQGRLLSMISNLMRPELILEIGTFTGYSALCLAEGLSTNGKLMTIEANSEFAFKASEFIKTTPFSEKIEVVNKEGLSFIQSLSNSSVDLVFVDADKLNYKNYYEALIDKVKQNGLLVFDNVLWSEKVLDDKEISTDKDTQAMHEFNVFIANQNQIEKVILPMRDGLGLYRKIGS